MIYRVVDRQGNCLMSTDMERLARRFVEDNPERGYTLKTSDRHPRS